MSRPTKYNADVIRLHGMGLPRHDKHSERDEQIVSLYTQGLSQRQIQYKLKITSRTIKSALTRLGVPARPAPKKSRFSRDDIDRMIELTRQGMRQVDIAKEFGTCAGWVSTLLKHEAIFTQPSQQIVSDTKAKQ